jgi:hypothetical protein
MAILSFLRVSIMIVWSLHALANFLGNPTHVSWLCFIFIVSYYLVSVVFIWAQKMGKGGLLKKNSPLDMISSGLWIVFAVVLIFSLFELASEGKLSLGYLVLYYIFFIFLFAFLYGLLEWHWPGMLMGVNTEGYEAELLYLLVSIGAQTGSGYTRARPTKALTELIAAIQTLVGLFFTVVFIALAVNRLGIP